MNVSLEYLQRCAAQTGYRVEPLEKVVRLGIDGSLDEAKERFRLG